MYVSKFGPYRNSLQLLLLLYTGNIPITQIKKQFQLMPGKCQSFSIKTTNEIELKMEFITIFIVRGHTHKSESNKTIKLKWRSNTNRKKKQQKNHSDRP